MISNSQAVKGTQVTFHRSGHHCDGRIATIGTVVESHDEQDEKLFNLMFDKGFVGGVSCNEVEIYE